MATWTLGSANDVLRLIFSPTVDSMLDIIFGGSGNDHLDSGRGIGSLYGGIGNDRIDLGYGTDTGFGEDGNDIFYIAGSNSVTIYGGSGDDHMFAARRLDLTNTKLSSVETLVQRYGEVNAARGDLANFSMHFRQVSEFKAIKNVMHGAKQISVELVGSGIADFGQLLAGPEGLKVFATGPGASRIILSKNSDWVISGAGHNVIHGGQGNDTIDGGSWSDDLYGGLGNDRIYGDFRLQRQPDTLYGGSGNDTYYVGQFDRIFDDGGYDQVVSYADFTDQAGAIGVRRLPNSVEKLVLAEVSGGLAPIVGWGNDLANSLVGNRSANSLSGFGGNDTLNGGGGSDTMAGGSGVDTFVFSGVLVANGQTQLGSIIDFSKGEHISLKGIDGISNTSAHDPLRLEASSIPQQGEFSVIMISGSIEILINTDLDSGFEGKIVIWPNGQLQPSDFGSSVFLL